MFLKTGLGLLDRFFTARTAPFTNFTLRASGGSFIYFIVYLLFYMRTRRILISVGLVSSIHAILPYSIPDLTFSNTCISILFPHNSCPYNYPPYHSPIPIPGSVTLHDLQGSRSSGEWSTSGHILPFGFLARINGIRSRL
jgi:hypothetical protein